jgi:3-phenylpropionate/trans-cinnamate dioxygenase ferredoxin reductase subunit
MVNRFEVVVVGTGHGGVQTVTSLRQQGFSGSIALVGAEDELPYERPPLSKSYLRGAAELDDFRLKPVQFWEDQNITLLLGSTVETVDVDSRQLTFSDGRSLSYEHLVWAAGGRARQLPLPGADLSSVYTIREFADVDRLRRDLADSLNAVIIGGGYIGLEAAAVLRAQGLDVTVLEAQDRLLARVTCSVVSDYVAELHRRHGTDVRLSAGVDSVQGEGGRVTGVRLSDGSTLPADVVIVGVGLIPNVEPLASAGIVCTNGADVDADFKTSADGVFAIGDCANYVSAYAGDVRVRLESVPNAAEHGRAVANVILGIANEQTSPPWFWSHQFDTKIQTVGLQQHHDEVVVRGDRTSDRFSVVYLQNGQIIALDCINKVGDFAQGKQLVARGVRAEAHEIDDPDVPLKSLLAKDAAAVPS